MVSGRDGWHFASKTVTRSTFDPSMLSKAIYRSSSRILIHLTVMQSDFLRCYITPNNLLPLRIQTKCQIEFFHT